MIKFEASKRQLLLLMTAALKLFKWPGKVSHADILSWPQNKYPAILLGNKSCWRTRPGCNWNDFPCPE